jgi:putative Mg2+ transporter-C (MgtC) family protein
MMVDPFEIPGWAQVVRVGVRLLTAVALGGVLGYERELRGKAAGLRTHMLVALGAALLVVAALESGMEADALSRVVQGVATGIGFIGAGTILKGTDESDIKGLTTAASVWLSGAVGLAVGAGRLWIPVAGVLLALVVMAVLRRVLPHPARRGPD